MDMDAKGRRRQPKGSANGQSVLTEDDVVSIRTRSAAGESAQALADVYGVAVTGIRRIKRRDSWRHVP
jgi:hypothetical protein